MLKALIAYFSQGGTTGRVAESIAKGLRSKGYESTLCNLKTETMQPEDYDLIGIGSPVYYYRPPFNVTDYLKSIPALTGLPAFVFVVHGTYRFDCGNLIREALAQKGIQEVGYFHCYGIDYFLPYLKIGYLFSHGHPTAEELSEAENFGREVAATVNGKQYLRTEHEQPAPVIYRLERFFTNRWLATKLYSRLFKVDSAKCNACGLCAKLCPTENIAQDENGQPKWGRNCLLCLNCEMRCPKEAISSPSSSLLFRPFFIYNVNHASKDESLNHVKVIHSHGRTQPI